MSHIFLDLETLDLRPSAVITEIAAVEFDPQSFDIGRRLDLHLSADDQVMLGRTVDPETVTWHEEQGHSIKMAEGLNLALALSKLHDWVSAVEPERVWAWGPDFDRPVLESACRRIDLEIPWPYFNTMDARTIWNLAFPTTKRPKRPHAALGDCLAGVNDLRTALSKLNLVDPCYV